MELVTVVMSAACYTYYPATFPELMDGDAVRVRLSAEAAQRLEETTGMDDRGIDGEVAGREGDEILVDVPVGTQQSGFNFSSLNQRVALTEPDVVSIERRELSQGRTAVVLGAIGVAAGIAAFAAFGDAGGTTGPADPGSPGDIVIPVVRLVVP